MENDIIRILKMIGILKNDIKSLELTNNTINKKITLLEERIKHNEEFDLLEKRIQQLELEQKKQKNNKREYI